MSQGGVAVRILNAHMGSVPGVAGCLPPQKPPPSHCHNHRCPHKLPDGLLAAEISASLRIRVPGKERETQGQCLRGHSRGRQAGHSPGPWALVAAWNYAPSHGPLHPSCMWGWDGNWHPRCCPPGPEPHTQVRLLVCDFWV